MSAILTLTIVDGNAAGAVMRFPRPCRVIVGRAEDADIRLDDLYVSRHHLLLEINPPVCRLRDLTSANGATGNVPHINGHRAHTGNLTDGDVIEVGYTHLRVGIEWQKEPGDAGPANRPVCAQCGRPTGKEPREQYDGLTCLCRQCLPTGGDSAGTRVGEFELITTLGEGTAGKVFLAWREETGEVVALKRIRDLGSESANQRFESEVRVLRRLSHPGVARHIGSGIHAGAPFLITEYVAGPSLAEPRAGGEFDAVGIIAQVLDALQDMHEL